MATRSSATTKPRPRGTGAAGYPREHWTVNRRELHELMAGKQVRVVRKTAPVAAAIDALQAA